MTNDDKAKVILAILTLLLLIFFICRVLYL